MTARSSQFPIPRVYPPGYARARPLFALSAAGAGEREVPRVTNVHDPRRSFFLSFARGHIKRTSPGRPRTQLDLLCTSPSPVPNAWNHRDV
jgi:hypothetical protein